MADSEIEDDPRVEGPVVGPELPMLLGFLQWQRDTFELKCRGLDAEQMATRSVEPSSMSLLGMVRHLAEVERNWFRVVLSGQEAPGYFHDPDNIDGDWDDVVADDAMVAEAWAVWRREVAYGDQFVADAPDLDVTGVEKWHGDMSLRWVLIHLIEEYARHNGHADLLRERIDGETGE